MLVTNQTFTFLYLRYKMQENAKRHKLEEKNRTLVEESEKAKNNPGAHT